MTTRQALDDHATGQQAHGLRADEKATAFRQLATRQLSDSYRLASAILGDPTEARDAVHDAFVTAWRKWDTLRDQQRFEAWFGRIVVNTCRDRLRRGSRLTTDDGALAESLPAADPIAPIHERLRIEAGLARLKADDQVVLALRYYRDLKVDDIAALLEIPSGTVMSRLHNAPSAAFAPCWTRQTHGGLDDERPRRCAPGDVSGSQSHARAARSPR